MNSISRGAVSGSSVDLSNDDRLRDGSGYSNRMLCRIGEKISSHRGQPKFDFANLGPGNREGFSSQRSGGVFRRSRTFCWVHDCLNGEAEHTGAGSLLVVHGDGNKGPGCQQFGRRDREDTLLADE